MCDGERLLMRKRVAILHQGFIPVYRVKFYELLNRAGDISYVVFHGAPPSDTGHYEVHQRFNFPNVRVMNRVVSLGGYQAIYQPVIQQIVSGAYDAVVLGHEVKFLSNLVLFALCQLSGTPVLWWGHGFAKEETRSLRIPLLSKTVGALKSQLARSADRYLVYSEGGSERLQQAGMPGEKIAVVRNTMDLESECQLHARFQPVDPLQIRQKFGLALDSWVLLYIGRLYKEKRIEELLELVKHINHQRLCHKPVEAVIIGEGPELDALKTLGQSIPGVYFTGAIYDQGLVAQYLRIATAMVIPGKVGLAVTHAFAHGVPVITRCHNLHAPEVEYIDPGQNGLVVSGEFEVFLQTVVNCLNGGHHVQMSAAALQTRERLTLDYMVQTFHEAVLTTLAERRVSQA
jgi:glycosyltransferase involved in cell wall biosynthesis